MEGTITITKDAFLRLQVAEEELGRLNGGGVDGWDWYDDSLNPDGEISMDDWEEREARLIDAL